MSLNTFRKYPDKKRRSFIRTKIFCRNFGRPIKQGSFVSSLGQAGAGDTAAPAPASLMVGIINGWFTHHKEHSSLATRAAHVNGIKYIRTYLDIFILRNIFFTALSESNQHLDN